MSYVWGPSTCLAEKKIATLATTVGRLIKIDDATENRQRLDVARVLFRIPILEFINKIKKVQINKKVFTIRIIKEICECATFQEELETWEHSVELEGYDTENSDDTFIPPSVTFVEDE